MTAILWRPYWISWKLAIQKMFICIPLINLWSFVEISLSLECCPIHPPLKLIGAYIEAAILDFVVQIDRVVHIGCDPTGSQIIFLMDNLIHIACIWEKEKEKVNKHGRNYVKALFWESTILQICTIKVQTHSIIKLAIPLSLPWSDTMKQTPSLCF